MNRKQSKEVAGKCDFSNFKSCASAISPHRLPPNASLEFSPSEARILMKKPEDFYHVGKKVTAVFANEFFGAPEIIG